MQVIDPAFRGSSSGSYICGDLFKVQGASSRYLKIGTLRRVSVPYFNLSSVVYVKTVHALEYVLTRL